MKSGNNNQQRWFSRMLLLAGLLTFAGPSEQQARAQSGAQQLPLSGRQATGSVSAQESSVPGGGTSSVNTINSSVQVGGPYQGSVPDSSVGPGSLRLTWADALQRALRFNLGSLSAANTGSQVRAQRLQALSRLLPNISASMSITEERTDLEALGLTGSALPASFSTFAAEIPRGVGPFHYYDARGTASQTIFDGTALNNYRSAKDLQQAAQFSDEDARQVVLLAAGSEYLRTLSVMAMVDSQVTQVQYAQASYDQASAQYKAGTKAAVDAERSLVQLQTEEQRLTTERADLRKQKYVLCRVLGLPLTVDLRLAEQLTRVEDPPVDAEGVLIERAHSARKDFQASAQQLKAAERALAAARFELVPSITSTGFYGLEGTNPNRGVDIFSAAGQVNIPVWAGGRERADRQQAEAAVAQRRAEYADEEQVVELDVRTALIDLQTSGEQVATAVSNRELATNTLKQSQDRFAQGVATSVEVVQSTQALAEAESDYINSLYAHYLARLTLARATGTLLIDAPTLVKEQH